MMKLIFGTIATALIIIASADVSHFVGSQHHHISSNYKHQSHHGSTQNQHAHHTQHDFGEIHHGVCEESLNHGHTPSDEHHGEHHRQTHGEHHHALHFQRNTFGLQREYLPPPHHQETAPAPTLDSNGYHYKKPENNRLYFRKK